MLSTSSAATETATRTADDDERADDCRLDGAVNDVDVLVVRVASRPGQHRQQRQQPGTSSAQPADRVM